MDVVLIAIQYSSQYLIANESTREAIPLVQALFYAKNKNWVQFQKGYSKITNKNRLPLFQYCNTH